MKKRILTIAVALILFTAYTSTVSALDTYGPGDPGVPYNPPIGGDTADITSGENQGNGGTTGEDDGTTKCRDLGYVDASKCNGKMELKCPFKTSMVYCSSSPETPDEPDYDCDSVQSVKCEDRYCTSKDEACGKCTACSYNCDTEFKKFPTSVGWTYYFNIVVNASDQASSETCVAGTNYFSYKTLLSTFDLSSDLSCGDTITAVRNKASEWGRNCIGALPGGTIGFDYTKCCLDTLPSDGDPWTKCPN